MRESVMERRRVPDEAFWGVNGFSVGRIRDGTTGIRGC